MAAGQIEFETPENVLVSYQPAGLGSRFVALVADFIILILILFFLLIIAAIAGAATAVGERYVERALGSLGGPRGHGAEFYVLGLFALVLGLGSFLYFGLSEYLMGGQTLGKRWLSIRVVKVNGFSLDASSIFLRNVFRIIENPMLPPLWLVPLLSKNSQRLGDMVAGTVVISDAPAKMSTLRERLLRRPASEAVFRFDATMLQSARANDFEAIEKILERWPELRAVDRERILEEICAPLSKRLNMDPPEATQRLRFLEDLLAAEYRRQHRQLG